MIKRFFGDGFASGLLKQGRMRIFAVAILSAVVVQYAFAEGSAAQNGADITSFILALVIILAAAKIGGELFARMGQPAVLGELLIGIALGNLYLTGYGGLNIIREDPSLKIMSELGIILLLFQVGLESDLHKMVKTGASAMLVAVLGVVVPMALGYFVSAIFLPDESVYAHAFTGAALCATSVGITARVFMDLGKIDTAVARIVLGAAVIDDVLGLLVLAIVQGLITATSSGTTLSGMHIAIVIAKAVIFLAAAIFLGRRLAAKYFSLLAKAVGNDLLLFAALIMCLGFAYLAALLGLAPIVGAFAAGLVLDEVHWRSFSQRKQNSVEDLIAPIAAFLVPIFFVRMGSEVDILSIAKPSSLLLALSLTVAAIIGKQVCGFGVLNKGVDKLTVGFGMIPRGEVGLIFAAIGSSLKIDGVPVVGQDLFAAIVLMVLVTTMVTPPLLKWRLGKDGSEGAHPTPAE